MVSFQCDACCDVVKKPKLDQHRLRCQSSFTCIDCSTTFAGPHEYKAHTSCVSEAQKYEKSLYKGPKQDGRQNKPIEQQTNNGWGAGSRTYGEYQQGPHQRNGRNNIQQRGRRQQRPMGSGANELPLGRELRMAVTQPEGTAASEWPKPTQRSEPQPTTTPGGSVRALPAIARSQDKGKNKRTMTEQREGTVGSPLGSTRNEKKKGAPELEKADWDKSAVYASTRPVTVPEPIIEERKKTRKRKERDDVIEPEGPTTMDTPDLQVQKKKRKKEQGKGKEREMPAVSEPMPIEAMAVRADEPKKQKRDTNGKGKERDAEKAAKKARKAERKLEKLSGINA